MKWVVLGLIGVSLLSCKKENIISKEGSIDLFSSVYFNASKGLKESKQFHISRIDYKNDTILEFVPYVDNPAMIEKVSFITDNKYYEPVSFLESRTTPFIKMTLGKSDDIYNKQFGAKWINFSIPNFDKRIEMNDTTLYGNKDFKRFKIIEDKILTIYYVKKTDTILPYSINSLADKFYNGRLERIDSYDKGKDIFTTLVLIPHKNISEEGSYMFKYNEKLERMAQKKK